MCRDWDLPGDDSDGSEEWGLPGSGAWLLPYHQHQYQHIINTQCIIQMTINQHMFSHLKQVINDTNEQSNKESLQISAWIPKIKILMVDR